MRRTGIAIALVSACSFALVSCNFSHGIIGDQQDASTIDTPTSDASIIDTPPMMIDAMIDAPPAPVDTDTDGVPDSADNCPTVANTNQRNHDGDAKGDACDGCPHLASATDPDGDLDGVGDACDPRPTQSGDQRVLFEGFYDANATAGWDETGNGNWSVANGVLTQSSANTSTTTHTLGPNNFSVARAAVTAGAHVIALGNGNGFESPHVSVASGVASNQSYWCSVVDEGNNDKIYATIIRPFMGTQYPNADWPGTFAANADVQLTSALLGTDNNCRVVQGATNANVQGTIGTVAGGVQVGTRSASASFDYLFVVSIGN